MSTDAIGAPLALWEALPNEGKPEIGSLNPVDMKSIPTESLLSRASSPQLKREQDRDDVKPQPMQLDSLTPPNQSSMESLQENFSTPNSPISGQSRANIFAKDSESPSPAQNETLATSTAALPTSRFHKIIPLTRLIPAGTIVLRQIQIPPAAQFEAKDQDGWIALNKTVLACEAPGAIRSAADTAAQTIVPQTSPPRSKLKRTKAKSLYRKSSPVKKTALTQPAKILPPVVQALIKLADALILRSTLHIVDHETVTFRVYLIPQDLPELELEEFTKGAISHPGSAAIFRLLNLIRRCASEWQLGIPSQDDRVELLMHETDTRSILELYQSVDSPPIDSNVYEDFDAPISVKNRLHDALQFDPPGMTTELYPYQKASLAKMLARELAPQMSLDPAYSPRTDMNGAAFYAGVGGYITKTADNILVQEPRSGILAEDMGSGKTCICIALIMSTLGDLPIINDVTQEQDQSVNMTQLSRSFPFEAEMREEERLRPRIAPPLMYLDDMDFYDRQEYLRQLAEQTKREAQFVRPEIPSLSSILINLINLRDKREFNIQADAEKPLPKNISDQLFTPAFYNLYPPPEETTTRSGRQKQSPARQILLGRSTLVVVPTDLVIQWKQEINKHVDVSNSGLKVLVLRTSLDGFRTAAEYAEFDLVLLSVARFGDSADELDEENSLLQIHWKRCIIDEGHILSGGNRTRLLAEKLRCQSNWAISGTISTNLRASNDSSLAAVDHVTGGDQSDFQKLAQIFSRFLRHPAFPRPEDFRKIFTVPILESGRGAARLANTFNQAIVRNSAERIKQAYTLPAMHRNIVYIELGEAERKVYNALLALFSVNSVLTQRIDQDYFFHKAQHKALDELSLNLAASSCFFASTELMKRLKEAIENCEERLASKKSENWSNSDRESLKHAIAVMKLALNDKELGHVMISVGISLSVQGMPKQLMQAHHGLSREQNSAGRDLLSASSLTLFARNLKEIRKGEEAPDWKDDEDLIEELTTTEMNRFRNSLLPDGSYEVVVAKQKEKERRKFEKLAPLALPENSFVHQILLKETTSAKINYVVRECLTHPNDKFVVFSSSLPDLIFAQLSEVFDLVHVPYVIYAAANRSKRKDGKGPRDRGNTAKHFNEVSPKFCQVILVDARLGGRGVSLIGDGSKVRQIMLEPIWQPDLELQASKRAHRLGQTQPVELQILVVPNSYEDELLKRRSELNQTEFNKTKQPQRDSRLAQVLQSAKFLQPAKKSIAQFEAVVFIPPGEQSGGRTEEESNLDTELTQITPTEPTPRKRARRQSAVSPTPPKKKAKKTSAVHFADA